MLVEGVNLKAVEGLLISREMAAVIPPHRVNVCLGNLLCENWVIPSQESVKIFIAQERLLLNYLGVDIR